MGKHSEGPWSIDKGHIISGGDGMRVAYADLMSPDDEALVLAAPDLIEALEWMVEHCEPRLDHRPDCIRSAKRAIAKARGEK